MQWIYVQTEILKRGNILMIICSVDHLIWTHMFLLLSLEILLSWCYSNFCNELYLWIKRHNCKLAIFSLSSIMKFPLLNLKHFLNIIILYFDIWKFCGTFSNECVLFSPKPQGKLDGLYLKCQSAFIDSCIRVEYKMCDLTSNLPSVIV